MIESTSYFAAPLNAASSPATGNSRSSTAAPLAPSPPARSASCSRSAEASTRSSAAPAISRGCWISRRAWIVRDRSGFYLDPRGQTVMRPDSALLFLDPDAAAERLRGLGVDLSRWRLVAVLASAPAGEFPRQWRVSVV